MYFILEHYIKGLASLLLVYIVGHFCHAFIRNDNKSSSNEYMTEFIKLVLGVFITTASYAVVTTQFKTIFIGFFFIGFVLFLSDKSIVSPSANIAVNFRKISLKNITIILLGFTPFYLWQVYNIYDYQSNNFYHTHPDYYYYAGIIDFLNTVGKEQSIVNYFGADNTITLYHYGELWMSALHSKLFNTLPLFSFYLYTWPFYFLLVTLGGVAILKAFNYPIKYIGLLFIVVSISFWYPKNTIFTQGVWLPAGFNSPKYMFNYVYVIIGVLVLRYNINIKYLSVIAGITVLFNTSIGPTILLFHFLFLVYLWFEKRITIKYLVANITFLVVPVFLIGLTFLINSRNHSDDSTILSTLNITNYNLSLVKYVKTAFNCSIGVGIKTFLSVAPFLVLIFFSKSIRRFIIEYKTVFSFILIGLFSSFLSYGLLWPVSAADSLQLWYQMAVPLTIIGILILILKLITHVDLKFQIPIIIILMFLAFLEKEIKRSTKLIDSKILEISNLSNIDKTVFIKDSIYCTTVFTKNINAFSPIPEVVHYSKNYWPIGLSIEQINTENSVNDMDIVNIVKNSVFYKFIKQQHESNTFTNIEKSKIDFIKKHGIEYLIVFKDSKIPDVFNTITYNLIYKLDEFTLYRLKY
jgi:hypothetical protein